MAQITDEAVRTRTGKRWEEWYAALDERGARELSHKEIVALLREDYGLSSWWQQAVTVAYEKARGMREKHERPEGYEISVSRTLGVPVQRVYRAWADDRERLQWMSDDRLIITTRSRDKSVRGTWAGGPSRLAVYFYPKSEEKTQLSVNHMRLASADEAEATKSYWIEVLARFRAHVEGG